MEKLYKGRILKKRDLADLWREILPIGVSGRAIFLSTYFSKYDIEAVTYDVMKTVVACDQYKNEAAVEQFISKFKEDCKVDKDVMKLQLNNNRLRIVDAYSLHRFKKLVMVRRTGRNLRIGKSDSE